ncbi:unnamed protein product [Microthlaspi erraticum]|uniref:Uncharacterized protein n=1 Tax=Microthlaspi erraticum TaxID=1685480 RepID=A0A6D2KFX0_9BRAS|nr:unnamed protein product [Microthlaspi erraticum]CAA7051920.1 unnamed protein product [Microthlaspi erraticum]
MFHHDLKEKVKGATHLWSLVMVVINQNTSLGVVETQPFSVVDDKFVKEPVKMQMQIENTNRCRSNRTCFSVDRTKEIL